MRSEELKSNLLYLINKYITDSVIKNQLIEEVQLTETNDLGVKGLLHEIQKASHIDDANDSLLIKAIVFNYC